MCTWHNKAPLVGLRLAAALLLLGAALGLALGLAAMLIFAIATQRHQH